MDLKMEVSQFSRVPLFPFLPYNNIDVFLHGYLNPICHYWIRRHSLQNYYKKLRNFSFQLFICHKNRKYVGIRRLMVAVGKVGQKKCQIPRISVASLCS